MCDSDPLQVGLDTCRMSAPIWPFTLQQGRLGFFTLWSPGLGESNRREDSPFATTRQVSAVTFTMAQLANLSPVAKPSVSVGGASIVQG